VAEDLGVRGLLVSIWALVLVAAPAAAQDDGWPEGSAMHTAGLHVKRRDAAAAVQAKLDARLLKLLSEATFQGYPDDRLITALKAQQAAWANYVPEECELIGAMTGAGGSWPTAYNLRCQANLAEQRVRRTRAAIRCVEASAPDKRMFEQSHCLAQLAPLALPLR